MCFRGTVSNGFDSGAEVLSHLAAESLNRAAAAAVWPGEMR